MPISNGPPDEDEYENVFRQYLAVCNQAIAENKDKFPYTGIWNARLKGIDPLPHVNAVVFDDRPKASYLLHLTPEMKIEISEKKAQAADDPWPFPYQYMKRVIRNPEKYIANPARLQWGWLQYLIDEH